jgi:hypothetical protein
MLFQQNSNTTLDFEKSLLQSDRFRRSKNGLFEPHIVTSDKEPNRPREKGDPGNGSGAFFGDEQTTGDMKPVWREKWITACSCAHSVSRESCEVKQKQKGFAQANKCFEANPNISGPLFQSVSLMGMRADPLLWLRMIGVMAPPSGVLW